MRAMVLGEYGPIQRSPLVARELPDPHPAGELVGPALEKLRKGGTLALAGIYMTPIPQLDYDRHLFYERNVRSVTANTRADGRELLAEAAEIPIRPHVTCYPLTQAN